MTEEHAKDTRATGSPVVNAGPDGGASVLVIDPAGAGVHGTLPASWSALDAHVAWVRLPAAGPETARTELSRLGATGPVHL
ncbi:MAG TPA: hypothetical protein VGD67_19135, partial [Pseudonocardiaceae bacterium]